MKKILFVSSLLITFLFVGRNLADAQAVSPEANQNNSPPLSEEMKKKYEEAAKNAIIIADVSVRDARVVLSDKNNFKIAFSITNNREIQTGVKYAVELVKKENNMPVLYDRKVFDEELTLKEGEMVPKVIDYEAPYFASGDFELWVDSTQENGLPLGQAKAGDVKLESSDSYIQLSECILGVGGGENKFKLDQGVDIEKNDNFSITCRAKSNFGNAVLAAPFFETRYRTGMGKVVSEKKASTVNFSGNEDKEITIIVPGEAFPQSYDVALALKDEQDKTVSNLVYFHYVTRGLSGTIQNMRLDKDSYAAGDTAVATFAISGSADNFLGARKAEGTKYDKSILEISITDALGNPCSGKVIKEIAPNSPNQAVEIPVKIDCTNSPKVTVTLKDPSGNVLDNFSAVIGKAKETQKKAGLSDSLRSIATIVIISLTILALLLLLIRKKYPSVFRCILFFSLFSLGMAYASGVQAVTFATPMTPTGYSAYEVNLDSTVYRIDQPIVAAGRTYYCSCGNAHTQWIYGWVGWEQDYVVQPYWGYGSTGAKVFSPVATPGSYSGTFLGRDEALASAYGYGYSDASALIPYQVLPPPPPAGDSISASPQVISYGQGTTISWNSWNAAYCALWGGPWNNTPITPNSAGSAWTGALYSDTAITIGCHNNIAYTWSSVTVTVKPTPVAYISASPNPIDYNGTSTISWSSNVDNNCWLWDDTQTMFNGWAGANGSVATGNLTGARGFHVQCYDSLWVPAPQADVTVSVKGPPTASISANPTSIKSGESTTISWSSTNAYDCHGYSSTPQGTWYRTDGSWPYLGANLSGSMANTLTSSTTYGYVCKNSAGAWSSNAFVTVNVCSPVYTCSHGADNCTNLPCGSTSAQTAYCTSSCGGSVPLANCGASCEDIPVSCTTCKNPGWKEVTP